MGYLLSFIDNPPSSQPHEHLEPSSPPTRSINSSPNSALVVESSKCFSNFLQRYLSEQGYSVRIATSSEEGLRLYRELRPFNVVLVNYCIPKTEGAGVDCLAPQQVHGIDLAMAIRDINPSQGIIIAALDYASSVEVPRPPEAMHIPLLVGMGSGQLRNFLKKIEIDRAIKALTCSDFLRLQGFAKFLIQGLGRAARGRDWQDLLEEAFYRTLIGAEDGQRGRHWSKEVTFVKHLAGAMRSIASVWKRQFREQNTYLNSELSIYNADGQEYSPIDDVPSSCASPDKRLIEESEEERVLALFSDDGDATTVLQGMMAGLNKNEIKSKHGLDEKKYVAAIRRIRVKLLSRRSRGKNNGK